jgi:type IV pilus assembly protein PilB
MNIEPYLLGDSIVGIIAQRLIRLLCPACKKPREATDEEKRLLSIPDDEETPVTLYEPAGCPNCSGIGYKGRTAVYEIMTITNKLRSLINDRANADEMKEQAVKEGMYTLRMAATREVLSGRTAINELIKVAYEAD